MRLSEEQKEATLIGENLIVNAGAGSGKTTVLTSRYIRLLKEGGLSPGQIVAITFTKKAAREMRERIDENLAALSLSDPRWEDIREQFVSAPIGTIHSFYAQVLRAFPVEAGINPGFRVLDEQEAGLLLDKAIAAAFQQAVAEKCPHLALLTEVLGAQAIEEEGYFSQQIRHIYKNLLNRGIPVAEAKLSQLYEGLPSLEQCRERILALASGEAELAAALEGKDKPEMTRTRQAFILATKDIAGVEAHDLINLYPTLLALTELKGGRVKGHKEFVNSGVKAVQSLLSRGLAPLLGQAVLALLKGVDEAFRHLKNRVGGLDFSDLQFAMWRLLENSQVVAVLDRRYLTYMIDEFQDTDRLQHKIIAKLVQQGAKIPPGRLFIVGDEKQSIYRFRGADVEIFNEVRCKLIADSPQAEKQITCNFRSRKPLIELVNALFSQLMAGEATDYIPLSAYRGGESPCAELFICPDQKDAAAGEAAAMAARIQDMVEGNELIIGDDPPMPVKYRDIAILIRSRTHIKEYEHHLRLEGIPYTVVGGIGFYEQQEVQDMLNLLRTVRNCWDEISLVAALRSPLFALDDDSIYALARSREEKGGSLMDQEAALEGEQRERLLRAKDIISQLVAAEGRLELPEYLELAMELTQYREAILTGYGGLQSFANLERLVDMAESFALASSEEDFLTWVEYAASQDEAEAQVDSEQSDSVRIMTIHASKGLQFPVVFLPVANAGMRLRLGPMLIDNQGGLAFRHPWQCPVWEEVKEQERQRELREYKRLLYVAMTRARDRLVFLTKETDKEEESYNYWISKFAAHAPEHFILKEIGAGEGTMELPLALPQLSSPEPYPSQLFASLAPVSSSISNRYFSISQFLLWQKDREEFQRRYLSRWAYVDPIQISQQEDWQHEPGGASFGSLLHSALETIDASSSLEVLLKKLVPVYFPDGDKEQQHRVFYSAKTLLEGYIRDPGPPGYFFGSSREQEFYYRIGNALFYGIIDRLLFAPDHVAIVDYKTNRIPPEGIGPLVDAYESQLRFYALVAKEIYKQPVRIYLQLLRLPPGRQTMEVELSLEKEEELLSQLRDFVTYVCQV